MMKQLKIKMPLRMLTLAGGLLLTAVSWAQSGAIKGQVKDASGEPVMGATIQANGKTVGITDLDGNYSVDVPAGTELTITYLGMTTQKVKAANNAVITMQDDQQTLNDVVVIGYGVAKKNDLTGSVVAINPDSKNKGLTVSAQDMLQGKVAGVNITSNSGEPGGGASIRIRGGSSLSASNDPLVVIDGVIMDNTSVTGVSNPLSMVNPQDIESFSVLKDASATAIYGSRGSNGVIIITTKKGHKGQKPSVSYAGNVSVSMKKNTVDVMDGNQFRSFITDRYGADSKQASLLGTANTDWQDEIYRTAVSHDHNVTVSGSQGLGDSGKDYLPYRVSVGYTDQQGILKTSGYKRATAALNLSPHFLDDHLTFNVNVKGMWSKNNYANTSAVGAAVLMDPTQPIYDTTSSDAANFGGYWLWKMNGAALNNPDFPNTVNNQATYNPVALLNNYDIHAITRDLMLSGEVDYKIHGFEDLHLHASGALDLAVAAQNTKVNPENPTYFYYGRYGFDRTTKRNMQGNAYALYTHDFNDAAKNHFDIMGGIEQSRYWRHNTNRYRTYSDAVNGTFQNVYSDNGVDYNGDGVLDDYQFKTEYRLLSYFGRANWSLMDGRYMLTGSFRADGSSRFKDRWGYFPAFAFAWRIKDENKFKDIDWLSDLKLRLSYGKTGQQDINQGDFPYIANYNISSGAGSYYDLFGDGTMARPNAYNEDLTWEKTTTYNIGVDFGVLDQRLTGSFDWYYRKTSDLINAETRVPMGTNFSNVVVSNIGDLKNTGVEFSLDWRAIRTKDLLWRIGYNFAYNVNKIIKLSNNSSSDYYIPTGSAVAGTGTQPQAQKVGYAANSFFVYQQVYDKSGKPIEGAVVDRNGDGQITDADRYIYKSPAAPVTMSLSSKIEWKNWDFGFNLRASLGNYVFNQVAENATNLSNQLVYPQEQSLNNRMTDALTYKWSTTDNPVVLSDRWVQNASFMKMDNITLGYSFDNLFKCNSYHGLSGRAYVTANNVFTITNYDGLDPEVNGGVDNNIYPRPFSVIVGLNLNF